MLFSYRFLFSGFNFLMVQAFEGYVEAVEYYAAIFCDGGSVKHSSFAPVLHGLEVYAEGVGKVLVTLYYCSFHRISGCWDRYSYLRHKGRRSYSTFLLSGTQ